MECERIPSTAHRQQLNICDSDNVVDDDDDVMDEEEVISNNCVPTVLIDGNGGSDCSRSPSVSSHDEAINSDPLHHPAIKQWSYEEQFRQLYNLSDEPERKEFLDKLFDFMARKGTPITRIPIMAKQPLDMYKLFKLVVERGGLVEVIKKKAWRDIAKELSLPASITSAAFTMRSQYCKYLYPYECEVESLSDPKELQMAIESNKRDRRHSDTMDYIQTCREERRDHLITQPTYTVTGTPGGLQLISSPTVAIPQPAVPPYSSSFILTPSGAQIVHTPRISPAGPQLLQMASGHPHLPIVVPTTLTNPSSLTGATIIKANNSTNCTRLPTERKMMDDQASPIPGGQQQLPILIHTGAGGAPGNDMILSVDKRSLDMSSSGRDHYDDEAPPSKRSNADMGSNSSLASPISNTMKMPFTNISVKPTGSTNLENSSSILVTMEFNGYTFQGVLFARPQAIVSTSPQR